MGNWHLLVQQAAGFGIGVAAVVFGVISLINCALQRADAFPVLGTLQKPAWLAILGGGTVLSLCSLSLDTGPLGFGMLFKLITLGAAAIYLLDVRPGLRDIANGHGHW